MTHQYPFYLAGQWEKSSRPLTVTNPYDDSLVATTWLADESNVEWATVAAVLFHFVGVDVTRLISSSF